MPWPELQGLLLAHLCHRYTGYESELAAGGDRETLRREIAAFALHAYPVLRVDPTPFPADPSLVDAGRGRRSVSDPNRRTAQPPRSAFSTTVYEVRVA